MAQKLIIILAAISFSSSFDVQAQTYPDWGPWWDRPEPHGYGGEAVHPDSRMSPDSQIQQKKEDEVIQQREVEDRLQFNKNL